MRWISRAVIVISVFFAPLSLAQAEDVNWQKLSPLLQALPALGDSDALAPGEDRPVVVTFFASWCPPCTDEFAHLNKIVANPEFADAQIIGVNVFEDFGGVKNPERMVSFLEKTDPQFTLLTGSPDIRDAFGGVDRIPTVVVFGKSGEEVWRFIHVKDAVKTHATEADLIDALNKAQSQ